MNPLVKWGLVGGGLLWLFWDQITAAADTSSAGPVILPAPAPPVQTPAPVPAPAAAVPGPGQFPAPSQAPVQSSPPAAADPYKAAIDPVYAGALGTQLLLSADEWNWYYSQATGRLQTADLFPAGNRSYRMPAAEYHQRRASAGLSGLVLLNTWKQ